MAMLATIRAELYNTSAKLFDRVFEPADFMPGATEDLEAKVAELVATGKYTASQAVAILTSKQGKSHNLRLINGLRGTKPGKRRA